MEGQFNFEKRLAALAAATSEQERDRLAEGFIDPDWPSMPTRGDLYKARPGLPLPENPEEELDEDYVKVVAQHICPNPSKLTELLLSGTQPAKILQQCPTITMEQIQATALAIIAVKKELQPPETVVQALDIVHAFLQQQPPQEEDGGGKTQKKQKRSRENAPAAAAAAADDDDEENISSPAELIPLLRRYSDIPMVVAVAQAVAQEETFDQVMDSLICKIRQLDEKTQEFKRTLLQGVALDLAIANGCPKGKATEICDTNAIKWKTSAAVCQPLAILKLITETGMYRLRHLRPTTQVLKLLKMHAAQLAPAFHALPEAEKAWWREGQTAPVMHQVQRPFVDAQLPYVDKDWLLLN